MKSQLPSRGPVFRLTALPPELISCIAYATAALGDATLLDLRLTSKHVSACCDDAFLDAFFAFRWHMYTEFSLRVLNEISRNARLRKRMNHLSLCFPAAEYMNIERHCRRKHKFGLLCSNADDSDPDGQLGCLWNDVEGSELAIDESCSEILEAALVNLKEAGVIPTLYACGQENDRGPDSDAFGLRTLQRQARQIGLTTNAIYPSSDNDAVSRVLVAIARTQFPVAHLDLANKHSETPCDPLAFGPMVAAWNFPWANLTKLSMTIHSSNLKTGLPKWSAFQSWLKSLRALQDLSIAFEWPEPDRFGHDVADWTRMLNLSPWRRLAECLESAADLSKLRLGTGRFGRDGVLHFLGSLASRLQGLTLDSCSIVDDANVWHDVFGWIADHMSLTYMHVRNLSNDCAELVTAADDDEFTLTGGSEHVKALLLEQIRTLRFTDDVASARAEAGDAGDDVVDGEDEYGPDFDESDLQVADRVEPYV